MKHLRGEKVPREIALPVVIVDKTNVKPYLGPVEDKPAPDWAKIVATQGK